jgi:hypothetical protein
MNFNWMPRSSTTEKYEFKLFLKVIASEKVITREWSSRLKPTFPTNLSLGNEIKLI